MKKYLLEQRYRAYNDRRARKSLEARLRFKAHKRSANFATLGLDTTQRKSANIYKDYAQVFAPKNFTLIGNPEEVIAFISVLKNCFNKKRPVYVVMRDVENIDYDAIVVLLSAMVRFKSHNIRFNGDFPKNNESKKILSESGFFDTLQLRQFQDRARFEIRPTGKNFISTHGVAGIVDSNLGASLIESASRAVWGKSKRCPGVQTTLVELMQNTVNHASAMSEEEKHWWLSVNPSKTDGKVRFSFVDYGVGIFRSLQEKPKDNIFYVALRQLFNKYKDNAELLRLIMNGELHKTVTGEYFRGQGLPGIKESMEENAFSNLHIISNNVYANINEGEYKVLTESLDGTFIYWEIDSTNENFDVEV